MKRSKGRIDLVMNDDILSLPAKNIPALLGYWVGRTLLFKR